MHVRDVAVASFYNNVVSIFLATGDGGFSPGGTYSDGLGSPNALLEAVAGDLNGDGIPDLAVAMSNAGSGGVGVLLGQGNGSFGNWTVYPVPGGVSGVAMADLAGDGVNEALITSCPDGCSLYQLRLAGGGSIQRLLRPDAGGWAALVGDFNQDGAPDVAALRYSSTSGNYGVALYLNGCP
jgi:hypothetical protein